jgi:DNA-binding XRE family transcriptional regulator
MFAFQRLGVPHRALGPSAVSGPNASMSVRGCRSVSVKVFIAGGRLRSYHSGERVHSASEARLMRNHVESPNDLGDLLKRWCREWHMSQSAFAMKVGVSAAHFNQIVNGQARPSRSLAQRILEALVRQRTTKPQAPHDFGEGLGLIRPTVPAGRTRGGQRIADSRYSP